MSTSPTMPKCSAVPRPVLPSTPVAWESSTTRTASCSRQISAMSGSVAIAPSIEKMPSVMTIRTRRSPAAASLALEVVQVGVR